MKKKIAALIGFLASSPVIAMAEEVWSPGKPIVYNWLQQLWAHAERVFACL